MPKKNEAPASFEKALSELEQIVTRLESGDLPLEEALNEFERGAAASIMLFGGVSVKERLLKETCEDSVAGLNRRANKIPPGIAINDAASKYSTGTPRAA